jgi:N-acetylmuramoyl-L-alanine amidase
MKFLLDPGHGGVAFGHYLTPGKRSPEVPPGIYEGEFNRAVCGYLHNEEKFLNIVPGPIRVPLQDRVDFVNGIAEHENVALISVHANAAGDGNQWNKANGFTIFTSKDSLTESRILARCIHKEFFESFGDTIKSRGIKQENFTVLKRSHCPAVLVECGFMTNKSDVAFLASGSGQRAIAAAIYGACAAYESEVRQ